MANRTKQKINNLEYLIKLSKGNTQFVNQMIAIFIKENPEEVEMLETAVREKDFDQIKSSAHKLKSSIYFVGLDKVIEKEISEIEELATNKSGMSTIEALFSKVKEMCARVVRELKEDSGKT